MAIKDCNLYKYLYLSEKGCANTSNDVINLLANDERQTMTYP